jgi:hypothetical protein
VSDAPYRIQFDNARDPYAARNALQIQPGVNVVALDSSGNVTIGGYLDGVEISAPSAPVANTGRIYFRDNGAGKTQLVVQFPTGVVQIIATEP